MPNLLFLFLLMMIPVASVLIGSFLIASLEGKINVGKPKLLSLLAKY